MTQNIQSEYSKTERNNLLINDYLFRISDLKSYISELEITIKDLKSQIGILTNRNIALIEFEKQNLILVEENEMLKQTISELKKEILNTIKKGKDENRDISLQLENEVNYYKNLNETVKGKIEAANHIIKLNSIQHNYIVQLENEIEKIKSNNLNYINELKVQHDLHYKNLKKNMIDFIKKSNNDIRQKNISNIELYSKFSAINKNEMLDQLENQNIQILELIKEKETQDKKILNLTQDNIVYHSIDKILKKNNLKLSKLLKNFVEKKNKKNSLTIFKKEDLFKTTMVKKEKNNYIKLENDYIDLLNKYNLLKEKHNNIKDKESMFQKRYYGIFKLYDIALKDLLKDEILTDKKIKIDLNKFMEGNIDTYSKEEKIKIIIMLMKHLIPLIKIQNSEIIKMKHLFNDINIKYKINSGTKFENSYSRNKDINMAKSFYNLKQYISDFDYSIKKEQQQNLKNNSIFNTYNKTFNNISKNNLMNMKNSKEESKSIKSSFFGLNINTSAIKKKARPIKSNENENNNNKNEFIFSAINFYKNNKKTKNNQIKLFKNHMIANKLMNNNSPLQRMLFFKNDENKNNIIKCLTENDFNS